MCGGSGGGVFMCLCAGAYVCMEVYAHVNTCMQRPEKSQASSLRSCLPCSLRQSPSLAWILSGQTGWPVNSKDLPVSNSLILGLQAHAIMPGL